MPEFGAKSGAACVVEIALVQLCVCVSNNEMNVKQGIEQQNKSAQETNGKTLVVETT